MSERSTRSVVRPGQMHRTTPMARRPSRAWLAEIRKTEAGSPLPRDTAAEIADFLDAAPGPMASEGAAAGASERDEVLFTLLDTACALGRRGHGDVVTVSRNVFIPLTNLCRDRCAYCTFAKLPDSPDAKTYALDEVRQVAGDARAAGCFEALFCLGDKPEVAYRSHRAWLAQRGYRTTAEYLVDACAVAYAEGLFPHTNAGVLSKDEMRVLRPVNASMGLMLENTSERLRERGQAHFYCPDKDPARRVQMTREAGELKIPFTSGILIGIGETAAERVDTLFAIRELHREHGHVQEVIVQNFHPKPETPMADRTTPSDVTMAATVALSRLILGPDMNIQAPPNLSPRSLDWLLRAGVNDWGGVSPVTCDFINPEAPWPALDDLRRRTEERGYRLRDRLAVYPEWLEDRPDFFEPEMLERLRAASVLLEARSGFLRGDPLDASGAAGERSE